MQFGYPYLIRLSFFQNPVQFGSCSEVQNPVGSQSGDRCQAKFLTSAKFLTCYCFSVILLLRIKK